MSRAGISKEQLARGGYLIRTTLNPDVQIPVKAAIDKFASPTLPGISSVMSVIEPGKNSHHVMAMASNRKYGLDTDAGETMRPQPFSLVGDGAGSIFKIFTTAAALDMGMGINANLEVPGRFQAKGMGSGGAKGCPKDTWCVVNAGNYRGSMNVTDALATSPNTAFAKLIQQVGVTRTVDMAIKLGLRSYANPGTARDYNPDSNESLADFVKRQNIGSFTLGPIELNALELSNVAATLASGGVWCPPSPIDKLIDRNGNEVSVTTETCDQVVPEGLANTLANAMSKDALGGGTAAGSAGAAGWDLPVSGKTGTTEAHRSSGFVGFTSHYAAANYIYDDSPNPTDLCSSPAASLRRRRPVRRQRAGPHLVHRDEADRDQLRARAVAAHRPPLRRGLPGFTGAQRRRDGGGRGTHPPQGSRLPGGRPNQLGQQHRKAGRRRRDDAQRSNHSGFDHHHSGQQRHPAATAAAARGVAGDPGPGRIAGGRDSGPAADHHSAAGSAAATSRRRSRL